MKKYAVIITFFIILLIPFNSYASNDENPFTDVKEGSNYYKEVLWAVNTDPQIVQGITKDKFKPLNTCNRAQMVTFLWRMKGCPEPETTKNPFKDVKTTDFFYKPVLWASENNITSGKSQTKFAPLDSCTRAQFVTFLWRLEDTPEVRSTDNPFVDVSSDAMYAPAVLWASRYKITSGKDSTHFAPNNIINRAQTVMFLYRLNQYEQGEFDDATRDVYIADNVANLVRVIYAPGDYEDSVINDLTLNTEFEGVNVSWSSSDTTIVSNNGKVTRPDGANKTVTLTATVKVNQAVAKRTFTVKVIRNKNIYVNALTSYTVEDINELNQDDPNFFIEYSDTILDTITDDDGNKTYITPVTAICGNFSDLAIECSDDAIVAVYGIKDLLMIDDPFSELIVECENHSNYGVSYTFSQYYDGIEVYGRSVTVSSDSEGIVTSVTSSSYSLNSSISSDLIPLIAEAEALNIVTESYDVDGITANIVKNAIYNLDEYENNPIPVYVINVLIDNSLIETVLLNSKDGSILCKGNQNNNITIKAKTESGKEIDLPLCRSPILFLIAQNDVYYIKDTLRNIVVAKNEQIEYSIGINNYSPDPTAVSAYSNMKCVYDWYKDTLDRKSVDRNGMEIYLSIDTINFVDGKQVFNNASWNGYTKRFYFYENGIKEYDGKEYDWSKLLPTTAADSLDVCAHEYTHGVVKYMTSEGFTDPQTSDYISSTINEAYADIFAWFIDNDDNTMCEDWVRPDLISVNKRYVRDLSNPEYSIYPSIMYGKNWYEYDENDPDAFSNYSHINSTVISHAAYLMSKGFNNNLYPKISMDKLINLWYESLSKGYDADSDFFTVRRNVLLAAKSLKLSNKEIATIKKAFDTVGINKSVYFTDDYSKFLKDELIPEYGIYNPAQKVFVFPPNVIEYNNKYQGNGLIISNITPSYSYLDGYDDYKRDHYREINADLSGIYYSEIGDFNKDSIPDLLVIRSIGDIPMSNDDILQKYYLTAELYQTYKIIALPITVPIKRIDFSADIISISDIVNDQGKSDKCLTIINNDKPEKYYNYNSAYVDTSTTESEEEISVISLNSFSVVKSCHYNGKTNEPTTIKTTSYFEGKEVTEVYHEGENEYFLFMNGSEKINRGLVGQNEEVIYRFYGGIANSFQREYLFDQ